MRLKRQKRAVDVNRLPLPEPWNVEAFVRLVAEARDRAIHVLGRPASNDSITGTVYVLDEMDVVLVRDDLQGAHRDHVICHELAHLLAGHTETQNWAPESVRGAAAIMLNRQCGLLTEPRELEAEQIADAILARAARHGVGDYGGTFA